MAGYSPTPLNKKLGYKAGVNTRPSLPKLMSIIRQDGVIWVSWPKKASKVATDVTEDVIRKELRKSTGKR